MPLFTTEQVTLRVDASPAQVAARLDERVTAKRFSFRGPAAPFRGWVRDSRFELQRARGIFRGDALDPVIRGEILPAGFGSEVRFSMRPDRFSSVFTAAWLGAAGDRDQAIVRSLFGEAGVQPHQRQEERRVMARDPIRQLSRGVPA